MTRRVSSPVRRGAGGNGLRKQHRACGLPNFVILTRSKEDAELIQEPVSSKLIDIRLTIHPDPKKTGVRDIRAKGLTFVGFRFTASKVRAKCKTVERYKTRFCSSLMRESKYQGKFVRPIDHLIYTVNHFVNPRILGPEPEVCSICGRPKDRYRNWVAFFARVVNDRNQMKQLDKWMRRTVYRYFYKRLGVRFTRSDLREAGMVSLLQTYFKQKTESVEYCICADQQATSSLLPSHE